ncbi:MAG: glycosyltransferase [Bacillota bacterium]
MGGEIFEDHTDGISKTWLENNTGSDVRFLGYINNMSEKLKEIDLFVLPSAYREGVPRVLLEAAATGIPIITTDSPGCREVVDNGVNGILVPPEDHIKLSESISNLVSDPLKLRNIGEKSREIAEDKFDLKKITEQYLELYN